MKRGRLNIFSCLLATILVALYLVSTMGYGVHECVAEGTRNVILLFGESPCEFVHAHEHPEGCCCGHCSSDGHSDCTAHVECGCNHHHAHEAIHNAGCCKTTVFSGTQDQHVKTTVMNFQAPSFDIINYLSDAREQFVIYALLEESLRVKDKIPLTSIGDILSDVSVLNI